MADAPYLSVVIPVYDEEASLALLHAELDAALRGVAGGVEILYVDDGSRDASLARLRELAARDPRVRVVALEGNHGQSAAFEAGFRRARGEVVATLDADGQNDPADLPRLLARLGDADVVNGVRTGRRDSLVRRLSSRVANGFRNRMTDESVRDVGCSLRVMRREFLERVKLWRGMHRFLPTLLRYRGYSVVEHPVSHRPRVAGVGKYGIGNRAWKAFKDLLAVRWMRDRMLKLPIVNERNEAGVR